MIVVYILVGILVGGLASYIFFNGKLNESKLAVGTLHTQLEAERAQHQKEIESLKDRFEHETELRNQQSSNEQQLRQKQFDQQLETIQEQFQNLASKILDQTTQKLKSENVESMSHITQPLKQNIEQLQQAIDKTNHETARSTASLSEQLKSMAEQTAKIDASATRLTNVMRGANKVQGNWGELTLMNLLDSQGLRLGVDYDVQQTLSDDRGNVLTNEESGKRMIPDVILHYPNNEDIIIDSKMTIDAYANYMNAEDEIVKKKYADDVVKSIRTQFTSLSKKDYTSYIKAPRRAIDFVIMYVPYEGALQLALLTDPKLWHDAFEKKVFITSQQNLMAILKIIQIAWRQYAQTENQKRVYDLADEMLRRVGDFIKRFDKVGKDIETLHKDYDEAYKKAYTGRQSIVQKANDLKVLGAKESANAPIPETQMRLDEA
ncbi:MAG: DNA recombination protein RmuC [Prevotella salivae]|jgi:putative rmuC domain protein|uniref:DNA recombination protein RmuC n=1 Tax=Segatella salivae TaxID=228604 RepID=UPI001CACD555|nr:DNA recombination protein RmuC [Segatella salivae]MBF1521587.1 DNA recombination protein RmuC [Segatella salivae]MBF1541020.1 DNA recombination protein RmuC [Segatella salivae]MBF1546246.1 DNA recombination protein RmuC [Segatella salivae]MBF1551307.1 DNA recombination protein RmuC [Segatella salivae]